LSSRKSESEKFTRFHGSVGSGDRACAVEGCPDAGDFRAPSLYGPRHGFDGPGEWRWLCLTHIREFNQGYDYFAGMDDDQIFAAQHPVHGWDSNRRIYETGPGDAPTWADFKDPLDAIGARFSQNIAGAASAAPPLSDKDQKALKTLGLGADATRGAIRKRYTELARKYHPDRNGGDRSKEKHLADVIAAYTQLKESNGFGS